MTRITGVTLALLVGLSAATCSVPAAAQDPLVTVAGADAPGPGTDRLGTVDPAATISGQLALRLADPSAAERAAASLAPRAAGWSKRFGPAPGALEAATGFLRAHGLNVSSMPPQGTLVNFSGPAGAIAVAFNTRLARYRDRGTGHQFQAAESLASLPSSLASKVTAVVGLTERWQRRHPRAGSAPRSISPISGAIAPADVRAMYGLGASPLTNLDGSGQTIGLLELGVFGQTEINAYDNAYYGRVLPAPTIQAVFGTPNTSPGFTVEVELDIEVIHAYAPGAAIKVYEAGNDNSHVNQAYEAMVNDPSLSAISTSWGLCEPQQGAAETSTLHAILVNAIVPIFAASGDAGAYDCRDLSNPSDPSTNPYYNTLAVDSPADDPMVTGAGGTSPTGRAPYVNFRGESAWARNGQGGGGGNSQFFSRPPWQAGPGTDGQFSTGHRQVPDVALAANPDPGYSIYTVDSGGVPGWTVVGGTSASAPGWAGAMAIVDQYRATQAAARIGPANPVLYAAAQCPQAAAPFHDVISGNNLFFPATAGWDYATGWGSVKLSDLATAIAAVPSAVLGASYMSSHEGLARGGQMVTITGCGFAGSAAVDFGGVPAAVNVVSSTVLSVRVPAGTAGAISVNVTNPGQTPVAVIGGYLYDAATIVGGTAPDHALWTSTNLGGFTSLGGNLLDAPAITVIPAGGGSTPLFLGTGANHDLWVRSLDAGWQPLTDSRVYCLGSPAAAVVSGSLVVACQGGDRALWWASTALPASGLPTVVAASWLNLGGVLAAGPAVTGLGGAATPTFLVVGTDHRIYARTPADPGYTQFAWSCTGHPALGTYLATSYFACQGGDRAVWYAAFSGGWSGASSLGGVVIDGPGVAVGAAGPQFFAEGANRAVFSRSLSVGWSQVGGTINSGVAAGALN